MVGFKPHLRHVAARARTAGGKAQTGPTIPEHDDGDSVANQPDRPDLFISYSRDDKAFVEHELIAALRVRGKRVWVDLDDIPAAADWRARIADGITAARAFVFVLSDTSVASPICREELSLAVAGGKRLIPVLRRAVDTKQIPDELNLLNWIFLRDDDDFDQNLQRLIDALETDLDWVDMHARLAVRAREWSRADQDRSLLLRGRDLESAVRWLADQSSHAETATGEQENYIAVSRQTAARRGRLVFAAVSVALVIALILAAYALVQRHDAKVNEKVATSRELAASARLQLRLDPPLALRLALRAWDTKHTSQAEDVLREAVFASRMRGGFAVPQWAMKGVAFPPTGNKLAVGVGDGVVRVIDRTGKNAPILLRSDGGATTVSRGAWSADGTRLVAGGSDGIVRVWDLSRPDEPETFRGHEGLVPTARFMPNDDSIISTGQDDGMVLRHHLRTGDTEFLAANGAIDVDVNRTGRYVAVGHRDGFARIYDLTTSQERTLPGRAEAVHAVEFSADGRYLVTVDDRRVRVWSLRPVVRVVRTYRRTDIYDAALSPDGSRVALAGGNGALLIWRWRNRRPIEVLSGHRRAVTAVTFDQTGALVASTGEDGTMRLWEPVEPVTLRRSTRVTGLTPTREGRRVALVQPTGVYLWDFLTSAKRMLKTPARDPTRGTVRRLAPRPDPAVLDSVAVTSDERYVATPSTDGTVHIWDTKRTRAKPVRDLPGHHGRAIAVAFDPSGKRVATADELGILRIWDWRAPESSPVVVPAHDSPITAVAYSRDGRHIATADFEGILRVRAAATPRRSVEELQAGRQVWDLDFSPDGKRLASATADSIVRVWRWRDQRDPVILRGHRGSVYSVQFHPRGRLLLTAGEDGTVRLLNWVTAGGTVLDPGSGTRAADAVFSSDGDIVFSSYYDGTVKAWGCDQCGALSTIIEQARDLVRFRKFTAAERVTFLHE